MADRPEGLSPVNDPEMRSFGGLIDDIRNDLQSIIRAEVQLARTEIAGKATQAGKAGIALTSGALLGVLGVACLVTTCIVALALVIPLWGASLLVGVVLSGAAGAALRLGRARLSQIDPVPRETVRTVREDLEWAKRQAH